MRVVGRRNREIYKKIESIDPACERFDFYVRFSVGHVRPSNDVRPYVDREIEPGGRRVSE